MPTATTKTKRAAPPAPAKKVAAKKVAPPPQATVNGDTDEPLIRVAFSVEDLTKLVDHIHGWEDSVAYRLRMRLAKHRERWG